MDQCTDIIFRRDFDLERELASDLMVARAKQITRNDLLDSVSGLRQRLMAKDPAGWDSKLGYLLIKDAFDGVQASDSHDVYLQYAKELFGVVERRFTIALPNNISLSIVYEKTPYFLYWCL